MFPTQTFIHGRSLYLSFVFNSSFSRNFCFVYVHKKKRRRKKKKQLYLNCDVRNTKRAEYNIIIGAGRIKSLGCSE